jgi:hypothetical protein
VLRVGAGASLAVLADALEALGRNAEANGTADGHANGHGHANGEWAGMGRCVAGAGTNGAVDWTVNGVGLR